MRRAAWLLALAACADPTPSSLLDGPRVLAIVADPPIVAPDVRTTLVPITTLDGRPTPPDSVRWRACRPWAVVADPERDCTDGAIALATDPSGGTTLDLELLGAVVPTSGPPPVTSGLCAPPAMALTLVAEIELAGARVLAKKQLALGTTVDRQNPIIEHVLVDGAPAVAGAPVPAGTTVRLGARIAASSIDPVCGPGEPERETVRVVVYPGRAAVASEDAFEIEERDGELVEGSVELTLPDAPQRVPLWLIAVDQTGGAAATFVELAAE